MATFPTHDPPTPLRPFVAAAHGYAVPANPTGLHRGLPSRHLTLVVELLAPLRLSGLGSPVAAHAVAGGLHTRPVLIDASAPQEGLQYALTPLGAEALLGLPASELAGRDLDLADLLPEADRLVARLQETRSWAARFRLLDEALLARLAGREVPAVRPEVAEAWRVIFRRGGQTRIGTVATHVGWGRRHLAEQFRLVTGLTPREAVRIARFEHARGLLLRPGRPGLADVAARAGYADQPHLAREWRALAGCSVGTWLREELPFVQDGAHRTGAGSTS
ncbi:AraC family transcriptional regulator [Georgenia ruanii]|uniref:Helix-turn-helix domain-containing protein n=1 Tax=Georgenia ruanii TaxID=348442 RepID=A0A7J9V0G7_9MICO|nr:helix-turn-helix domain-containing protein [Georgenia ruanii]MPV90381.1 helix-turn-helix domain-containing protein [Georgenia ruanii]